MNVPSAVYWLITFPALFSLVSIGLLLRYRGWLSFNIIGGAAEKSSFSHWTEREFILEQYRKFQRHTEKINEIIKLKGQVDARERRHDLVLRDLIETRQLEDACAYLKAMIAVCKEVGDLDGEITYIAYLDTLNQMQAQESAGDTKGIQE